MPPDYSLAKEGMSITRPKSRSLPRPGSLKVDSQSTALSSGSSTGRGVFPGTGKISVPGYHQSKADEFLKRGLLPCVICCCQCAGQFKLNSLCQREKRVTKLSNDSGRKIQTSLFLVLLCM